MKLSKEALIFMLALKIYQIYFKASTLYLKCDFCEVKGIVQTEVGQTELTETTL